MPPQRVKQSARVGIGEAIEFFIDDEGAREFLVRSFPKIVNSQLNRVLQQIGSQFAKDFTKKKLGKGGVFDVKTSREPRRTPRGQPSTPKDFRRAGIYARTLGSNDIRGKTLRISTSNPLLVIRERGGTIRPKKAGGFLYIRPKGSRRGTLKRTKGQKDKDLNLRRVRQVVVKANLEFVKTWQQFQPQARPLFEKGLAEVHRRAQLQLDKKAAAALAPVDPGGDA